MKTKHLAVTGMVALFGGTLLSAQAATTSTDDEMVVTATGFAQQKKEAPATISTIDRKTLNIQPDRNIGEAVKNLPGVSVSSGGSDMSSGNIMMRGMDNSYTAFMVNGVKQNTGESRQYGQDIGAEADFLPPLEAIERIEVIRGPMSSLYGSDAIGGVVNVITKKPYGIDNWTGAIAANTWLQEHQDLGNTSQMNLFAMGPLIPQKLGLSIAADGLDRRDDERQNYFGKHNRKSLDTTLAFAATENNLFDLNLVVAGQEKNRTRKRGTPYMWKFDRDAATLTHTGWYADDTISTTNYINYEKGRSKYKFDSNTPQYVQTENYVANSQTTFSFDSHKLTVGANFTREELNDRFDVANKTLPGGPAPITEVTRNGWALFAEDAWTINDFTLTTSARGDYDSYFGTHLTPKLYGNWAISDAWTLKGGVSAGYKKPDLRATSSDFITPYGSTAPYSFLTVGNEDLKPETSVNAETGLYWSGKTLSLDATVFYTEFKDKIDEQTICETTDTMQCSVHGYNAETVSKYFNVSRADLYGIELNADWQMTDDLKANANYTYNHSEQKTGVNKGLALNDFPRNMANLSLTWSATPALDLWSTANYRSSNRDSSSGAKYESYTVVDIGARYKLNKNTQLMGGVYNLFDTDPKRNTTWGEYGQIEGRRYNLGARIEF
ncbi:TonB-dependent receptor domain-containing protein [Phytobacter sp. V91]|uniref:TonB-dependent receptor domain-containing protein n=1 Tax=Phytobacter sp. V91 TaxID=3369425 RepID=UPI003F642710